MLARRKGADAVGVMLSGEETALRTNSRSFRLEAGFCWYVRRTEHLEKTEEPLPHRPVCATTS